MNQIPLPPFDTEPEPSRQSREPPHLPRKRRSLIGKAFRGIGWVASTPVQWLGTKTIRHGGAVIADLARRMRARSRRDPRFRTAEAGAFDLRATAFSYGISVAEMERRLLGHHRQTALAAYVLAGLGLIFFGGWLFEVLKADSAGRRLVLAIDFLPVCLLFVLLAFYQALINFQIRVGRAADWREYLMTDVGFWPRP